MTLPTGGAPDTDAATGPVAGAGGPRGAGWTKVLRRVFALAVVVGIVLVLWKQWDEVVRSLQAVSPWTLLTSLLIGMVATAVPAVVWRDLLAVQGYRVGALNTARTFFLAQLGKYVPGGIWALVAQVDLARDLGVPARASATATLLTLALSILAGLLAAGLTLPLALPGLVVGYWWVFLLLPVLLILLIPRVVSWWSDRIFRLMRRPGPTFQMTWGVVLRTTALQFVSFGLFGLHFALLVQQLGEGGPSLWLLSTGTFALGWIAGLLVVFAPAGAGVREGVLVLGFASLLPAAGVLTVALLSRLLLLVADVLLAAISVGAARLARRPGTGAPVGP